MEYNLDNPVALRPTTEQVALDLDERRVMLAQRLSMGASVQDLALELGVSTSWVRAHRKDPEVVALVKELQEEALVSAKLCLGNLTAKAARTMSDLLESPMPNIQLSAAKDILDRLGIKATEVTEKNININYRDLSEEELRSKILERVKRLEVEIDD